MRLTTMMMGCALLFVACLETKPGLRPGDAAKAELQIAFCDYAVRCGAIAPSHEADCLAADSFGMQLLDGRVLWREGDAYSTTEAIAAGRLAIDPAERDACIAGMGQGCSLGAVFGCLRVLEGRVADGAACRDDVECASGQCLVGGLSVDAGCEGQCVVRVSVGAECDSQHRCEDGYCEDGTCQAFGDVLAVCPDPSAVPYVPAHCAPGLRCLEGLCRSLPVAGEACDGTLMSCASGLTCVGGTCRPPGEAGAECAPLSGLGGLAGLGGVGAVSTNNGCVAGLFCDEVDARCRARQPVDAACAQADACDDDTVCIAERCGSIRDVGEPCTPGLFLASGCAGDLRCDDVDQRCVARDRPLVRLGGDCDPSSNEPQVACREGRCEPTSRTCQLFCGPL